MRLRRAKDREIKDYVSHLSDPESDLGPVPGLWTVWTSHLRYGAEHPIWRVTGYEPGRGGGSVLCERLTEFGWVNQQSGVYLDLWSGDGALVEVTAENFMEYPWIASAYRQGWFDPSILRRNEVRSKDVSRTPSRVEPESEFVTIVVTPVCEPRTVELTPLEFLRQLLVRDR